MHELQIFKSEEFGSVRTMVIGDEPYFVGKDVAGILATRTPRMRSNAMLTATIS